MKDEIRTVEYLGLKCMVITRNNINYYNVSNWGDQSDKESKTYSNWKRTDGAKEKIKIAKEMSGLDEVIISKKFYKDGDPRKTGDNSVDINEQGSYLYDDLAILFAMWVDNKFGFRVTNLVNQGIRRELSYKYESIIHQKDGIIHQKDGIIHQKDGIIHQKDDKIDELKRQLDEMMRDTKQVLRDNQVTHSKLEQAHFKLDVVQEELVETKAEREEISAKLDVVTDMLGDLAVNTVPTDGWNKFAVYKVSSSKYKAVRCRNSAYDKQVIRSIPSGSRCIYETDVPNGIEYFATFKTEYARNINKSRNIVSVSYNDISLKSVNEEEFINILHQHRKRIDEMLEEAQASQDTVLPK